MSGRAVEAAKLTLRAGAAALAGRAPAMRMYKSATAAWRSLGLPLHLALCLAEWSRMVPGPDSADAGAEAVAILEDLGAAGIIRAIRRAAEADAPAAPPAPAGVSAPRR